MRKLRKRHAVNLADITEKRNGHTYLKILPHWFEEWCFPVMHSLYALTLVFQPAGLENGHFSFKYSKLINCAPGPPSSPRRKKPASAANKPGRPTAISDRHEKITGKYRFTFCTADRHFSCIFSKNYLVGGNRKKGRIHFRFHVARSLFVHFPNIFRANKKFLNSQSCRRCRHRQLHHHPLGGHTQGFPMLYSKA